VRKGLPKVVVERSENGLSFMWRNRG
jgi:hypothetical protein